MSSHGVQVFRRLASLWEILLWAQRSYQHSLYHIRPSMPERKGHPASPCPPGAPMLLSTSGCALKYDSRASLSMPP